MKKRYKIGYEWWEMVVTINHTPEVDASIKESVEFWVDWEHNLEGHKGDYTKAFLANLFRHVIAMEGNAGFVRNSFPKSMEGYPPIDDPEGIFLKDCDVWSFEEPDYIQEEAVS